jgi:hypothetical protein
MPQIGWLPYLTAIGSIATPILVLALTALGWRLRRRLERRLELEDKLRDDRIETYNDILEPFVILFTSDEAWKIDPENRNKDKNALAMQTMLSLEYRRKAFKLSLVASDSVVGAYNNLMQFFFQRAGHDPSEADIKEMLSLMGAFLLEIRRSVGNESTRLDNWQMLEWFLTDARQYRSGRHISHNNLSGAVTAGLADRSR